MHLLRGFLSRVLHWTNWLIKDWSKLWCLPTLRVLVLSCSKGSSGSFKPLFNFLGVVHLRLVVGPGLSLVGSHHLGIRPSNLNSGSLCSCLFIVLSLFIFFDSVFTSYLFVFVRRIFLWILWHLVCHFDSSESDLSSRFGIVPIWVFVLKL